jgi:hypothetical protein
MVAQEGQQFEGRAEGPPAGHKLYSVFHDHEIKSGGKCTTGCAARGVTASNNRLLQAQSEAQDAGTHEIRMGYTHPKTGKKLPLYSFGPRSGLEKVKTAVGINPLGADAGPSIEQATAGVRLTKRGKPWVGRGHHSSPNRGGRNKKSGETAVNRKKKD